MKANKSLLYTVWRSGARILLFGAALSAWNGLRPERGLAQARQKPADRISRPAQSPEFQENLNSIDARDSKFSAPDVTLVERTPGRNSLYTSEHLRIAFRPAEPQDLFVIIPAAPRNPSLVIYMYSYPETVARFQAEQWALGAVARGFAAVGFSSALTGDGANRALPREEFLKQLPKSLVRSAHDIQLVLNYLASRGDLNVDLVGMYASGSGASAAILASSVDSRIKVLDVFNPWGAWDRFFGTSSVVPSEKRDIFLKPGYLESLAWLDPVLWFPKAKARIVRIQDLRQQDVVPNPAQVRIEDATPGFAEINQFEDYRTLLEMEGAGMVFGWIQGQLVPDLRPQPVAEKSKRTHYFAGKGHSLEELPPSRD